MVEIEKEAPRTVDVGTKLVAVFDTLSVVLKELQGTKPQGRRLLFMVRIMLLREAVVRALKEWTQNV